MALSIRRAHSTDISTFACPTEKQRFFQLFGSKPSKLRFVISVVDDILRNIARFQPTLSTASSAGLVSSNIPYDFAGSYYLRYEREERLGNVSGYSTSKFSEWKKKKKMPNAKMTDLVLSFHWFIPILELTSAALAKLHQVIPRRTSGSWLKQKEFKVDDLYWFLLQRLLIGGVRRGSR